MKIIGRHIKADTYIDLFYKIILLTVFLGMTRVIFFLYNGNLFADIDWKQFFSAALTGGVVFDVSAVCYFLFPYIIMRLLPFKFVYGAAYRRISHVVYLFAGLLMLAANMADIPYFSFTESRTQFVHIKELFEDAGVDDVIFSQIWDFPGVLLMFLVLALAFVVLSDVVRPENDCDCRMVPVPSFRRQSVKVPAFPVKLLISVAVLSLAVIGMRGFRLKGRPIGIADYVEYSSVPKIGPVVLNTPFSIVRTVGKDNELEDPEFYSDTELSGLRNNFHAVSDGPLRRKNVVMIILEGIGSNYIGALSGDFGNSPLYGKSLTPFLDSLVARSYVNVATYANLRRSSAGITSLLGGFPVSSSFVYMLSPYSSNDVETVAGLLSEEGYDTGFYCGCMPGSYNLTSLAGSFGYDSVSDIREFTSEYGDDDSYMDGIWGVFDEYMGDYVIEDLSGKEGPFLATWFTLNSHSPFVLPAGFTGSGDYGRGTMELCVEYVDHVMSGFFRKAAGCSWFDDTIFIITADHWGLQTGVEPWDSPAVMSRIPFIVYTPDGQLEPGRTDVVSSQVDLGPTILDLLDYPEKFFSLGTSIFSSDRHFALFESAGVYYYVEGDHILELSDIGMSATAAYDFKKDPAMKNDILDELNNVDCYVSNARAFYQDVVRRIRENRMKLE